MPFNDPTVRVVIPARFGSTRLPGKPLIDLAGKPMVVRVHDTVTWALPGMDVVVAADDRRIIDALATHGVDGVLTSSEWESGTDRVAEVARTRGWGPHDVVVNVQGDEPLLPGNLVRAFVDFCRTRDSFTMATVAVPVQEWPELDNPNVVKLVVDAAGRALYFSRARIPFDREGVRAAIVPAHYRRHVGMYAYSNEMLQMVASSPVSVLESVEKLEQLRALQLRVPIDVMDWHTVPPAGVDTAADITRVLAYLEGGA